MPRPVEGPGIDAATRRPPDRQRPRPRGVPRLRAPHGARPGGGRGETREARVHRGPAARAAAEARLRARGALPGAARGGRSHRPRDPKAGFTLDDAREGRARDAGRDARGHRRRLPGHPARGRALARPPRLPRAGRAAERPRAVELRARRRQARAAREGGGAPPALHVRRPAGGPAGGGAGARPRGHRRRRDAPAPPGRLRRLLPDGQAPLRGAGVRRRGPARDLPRPRRALQHLPLVVGMHRPAPRRRPPLPRGRHEPPPDEAPRGRDASPR